VTTDLGPAKIWSAVGIQRETDARLAPLTSNLSSKAWFFVTGAIRKLFVLVAQCCAAVQHFLQAKDR